MKMRFVFFLVLTGCVSPEQQQQQANAEAAYRASIPTCEGPEDCAAKWDAAQLWVVHNAGYKIQTSTNVVIETFNYTDQSSTSLVVQVTKEPLGNGRYRLVVNASCGNWFGCNPPARQAMADFNREVARAAP